MTEENASNTLNTAATGDRNFVTQKPLLVSHITLLLIAIALLLISCTIFGIPVPRVHDEFVYLLQSETLASFRLTNPTPPHHEFFETFHVIMEPSYTAKYLPGQAFPLVLGRLLGEPVFGVWIVGIALVPLGFEIFRRISNLFCAYIVTLFVYMRFFLFSYFGQSYWGGSFFMFSAGLMLLGVLIYRDRKGLGPGLIFGIGAGLCLLTRPFEGLFWGAGCFACLVARDCIVWRKEKKWDAAGAAKFASSALLCLVLAASFLFIYNHGVTGSCTKLPYSIYSEEFMPSYRSFIWEDKPKEIAGIPKPKVFNNFNERFSHFNRMDTIGCIRFGVKHFSLMMQWIFPYYTWILLIPFIVFLIYKKDRYYIPLLLFLLLMLIETTLTTNNCWPHYYAPWIWIAGCFYVLLAGRIITHSKLIERPAAIISRCVLLAIMLGGSAHSLYRAYNDPVTLYRFFGPLVNLKNQLNTALTKRYKNLGRKQIVFVQYTDDYTGDYEFVYNSADPYSSTVMWVRSLGPEKDRILMEYASDRDAWKLDLRYPKPFFPYKIK